MVIPVRDDAAGLARCLEALASQRGAPAHEVIVVDNGSTDDSVPVARRSRMQPLVLHESRPGSYAARNTGAQAARGRVLAFTDADCRPSPDWLAAGTAAVTASRDVVGGAIRMTSATPDGVWARYDRAMYLRQSELVQTQGFAATANLWVTRSVWESVGPFDATLRSSGDLEWGRRAAAHGFWVSYDETVVVDHAARTTALATWRLHRRLGAGWAVLARRGAWPSLLSDPAWRLPLGLVVDAVAADGPPLRRRQLAPVHALAMTARLVGRISGR